MRLSLFLLALSAFFLSAQGDVIPDHEGEKLARFRCSICHAYPAPNLLPRESWKPVLTQMGYLMGVFPNDSVRNTVILNGPGHIRAREAGLFPAQATIDSADWAKIQDFYLTTAPEQLPVNDTLAITVGLNHFKTQFPDFKLSPPSTTLVRFRASGGLYIGDANSKRLYWIDPNLAFQKAATLGESVVDATELPSGLYLTIIGSFSPTDEPLGSVVHIAATQGKFLLDKLQRPVSSAYADFNDDNRTDLVVCEFGRWTGALAWWRQEANGEFTKQMLRNRPGALRVYVRDFNADNRQDIIALFGQGDEGIFIYWNQGNGSFREERLLTFPPSYGSSSFRLADWNADGYADIVYTCGDNADFKPVLKPYHGVRIYLNDGHNHFTEHRFFPLNGAYDAVPADFDLDGDLDLAALSFFPDFSRRPQEAFVYFENKGPAGFAASTFPEVGRGRWMVMDAGDLDQDGDPDLVLGPLSFEVVPDNGELKKWIQEGIPFVILKNTIR